MYFITVQSILITTNSSRTRFNTVTQLTNDTLISKNLSQIFGLRLFIFECKTNIVYFNTFKLFEQFPWLRWSLWFHIQNGDRLFYVVVLCITLKLYQTIVFRNIDFLAYQKQWYVLRTVSIYVRFWIRNNFRKCTDAYNKLNYIL